LFAVVILLWAGYWLHNNSNARKWQRFIKEKIGVYLEKDKMFGLAAFSFMVVFREVFEVILFLKAISLEADANNQSAIGLGSITAVVILFVIAFFFMKYSSKIPIRQLFLYSSWLVVLLAFILTGKGIHSLQESGLISIHALPSWIQADWLGIYSTIESVLGQIILIIIVLIAYFYQKKQFNKLKEAAVKA
ncbi:MAG: FTR1 family protein, partial [Weeksellaceae bacterium]